jgi:predicted DNA-binding transcriptional regulator AlpA
MARIILRLKQVLDRLACGRTKFDLDYRYHTDDDPNVPGTDIPRVKAIPLGPRINGFLEHEIDELIDALAEAGGHSESKAKNQKAAREHALRDAEPPPQPAIKPPDALIDAPTRRQAQSKQTPHVAQRR